MEKHTKLFVGMTVCLALVLFGLVLIGIDMLQQQQEPTTPEETEEPCGPTG